MRDAVSRDWPYIQNWVQTFATAGDNSESDEGDEPKERNGTRNGKAVTEGRTRVNSNGSSGRETIEGIITEIDRREKVAIFFIGTESSDEPIKAKLFGSNIEKSISLRAGDVISFTGTWKDDPHFGLSFNTGSLAHFSFPFNHGIWWRTGKVWQHGFTKKEHKIVVMRTMLPRCSLVITKTRECMMTAKEIRFLKRGSIVCVLVQSLREYVDGAAREG